MAELREELKDFKRRAEAQMNSVTSELAIVKNCIMQLYNVLLPGKFPMQHLQVGQPCWQNIPAKEVRSSLKYAWGVRSISMCSSVICLCISTWAGEGGKSVWTSVYIMCISSRVYACAALYDPQLAVGSCRYTRNISRLLGSPSLKFPLQMVLPKADTDLASLLVQGLARVPVPAVPFTEFFSQIDLIQTNAYVPMQHLQAPPVMPHIPITQHFGIPQPAQPQKGSSAHHIPPQYPTYPHFSTVCAAALRLYLLSALACCNPERLLFPLHVHDMFASAILMAMMQTVIYRHSWLP